MEIIFFQFSIFVVKSGDTVSGSVTFKNVSSLKDRKETLHAIVRISLIGTENFRDPKIDILRSLS